MPILKNQMLLQSCYVYVPWSVAASLLTLITRKRYKWIYFKTYGYTMVHFTYNQCQQRSRYRPRNLHITASQQHLIFKTWHCVLPKDGRHAGEAHLMFY